MCADLAVHPVEPDHFSQYQAVTYAAFGAHPDPGADAVLAALYAPGRLLGASDGGRPVAAAGAFEFGLTLPGGEVVPVAGVSGVAVAPTHRRRGIMRQLMAVQLDDVAGRGEPLAALIASEGGIYRRFGYGIASFRAAYALDTVRVAFREPVGAELDLRLVHGAEALATVPPLYESWRRGRPGALTHSPAWWQASLGPHRTYIGGGRWFAVVCEPAGERGGGYAVYHATPHEHHRLTLEVRELVAEDPVVEARLWRYLVEADLVDTVRASVVPVDCALRWWLTDPRQVGITAQTDFLHVRFLDVPAALAARRYAVDGELVIDVVDRFRPTPATDGRFALAVSGGRGRCEPTARSPQLVLDVAELASLYLGGVRASELARAGLVGAPDPAAVVLADALFGWPVAPFCATRF